MKMLKEIALKIEQAGGTTYLVGGYVRDKLLNRKSTDFDVEVHHLEKQKLQEILSSFGPVIETGASFGILSIKGYPYEFALPRRESKTGLKHQDFEVALNPELGIVEAAKRRDFTINSIMMDVLTQEIFDPYHGQEDLKNKVLRVVNPKTFIEDPLRVFRGAQFVSRFGLSIESKTKDLMSQMDVSYLSKERVFDEVKKALLQSDKPSLFFDTLKEINQLSSWFKEVENLINVPQNPVYHAEGDVYIHTMMVVDAAKTLLSEVKEPLSFMFSALCHDFGKAVCTTVDEKGIHAYGHETYGLPLVESFIKRLTNNKQLLKYVLNMTELHMRPALLAQHESKLKKTNTLFDQSINPEDLILLVKADYLGQMTQVNQTLNVNFLKDRLDQYHRLMAQEYVTGKDLLELGLEPNEAFKEYLAYAHKTRLAGVSKEETLKHILGMLNMNHKKNAL